VIFVEIIEVLFNTNEEKKTLPTKRNTNLSFNVNRKVFLYKKAKNNVTILATPKLP